MSNLTSLTGSPRTVTLGGEPYQVFPLTLADLGELQAWLDTQLPDPLAVVKRHIDSGGVPMEQAKFLYSQALAEATKTRLHLSSPDSLPYLNSPAGVCQMLLLTVRKGRPGWTLADAQALCGKLTPADIMRLQTITELDKVLPAEGDSSDPNPATVG
jgi:hypothetical protein